MKKLIVAIVLATCIGILALPATAGGRKGNTTGGTSTIKLESYSDLRIGGSVGFDTNAVGLAGWEYPMVSLSCYQSGSLVYIGLAKPGAEFLLGGPGSVWAANGGGAYCDADLDAYGWKSGKESVRVLDSLGFTATG